ncbi:UNKNOWN [Stylonychia lemnae]|uniref:Uncharacterized protein n=1 Tax=Stylonychia lemnae TaxID=5949 RepID=A0A078A742_STYLE|nr:UNKNOWN [Stylonychia lemnae]|eukprot:CDW77367.1 UNKNOWN [Stylonychia lemnae]
MSTFSTTIGLALSHVMDAGMIIGPCFGYIIQCFKMKKEQSSEGFSPLVCLILLTANILRIFWWQEQHHQWIQAHGQIFHSASVVLLYLSVTIRMQNRATQVEIADTDSNQNEQDTPNRAERKMSRESNLLNTTADSVTTASTVQQETVDIETFWNWNSFNMYLMHIGALIAITFGMTVIFQKSENYSFIIEQLSVGIEALLGVPQFLLNYKKKNTEGLSVVLIFIWLAGDMYKFTYYIGNHSPISLVGCAFFQICTDICILSQFWFYRHNNKNSSGNDVNNQSTDKKGKSKSYSVISSRSGQSSPNLDLVIDEESDKHHVF